MGRVPSGRLRCKPHGGITLRNSPATGAILDQLAANDDHFVILPVVAADTTSPATDGVPMILDRLLRRSRLVVRGR